MHIEQDDDSSFLIRCKVTKSTKKTDSDFLKYNNTNPPIYENAAIKCHFYNKLKNQLHLLPLFYCKVCKIEVCDNCALIHLHNNDISSIISKEAITYDKDKILYELIELYERANTIFKEEEKIINKEREKFKEVNHYIHKRLEVIEKDYLNISKNISLIKNWQEENKNYIEQNLQKAKINSLNFDNFNYANELNDLEQLKNTKNLFQKNVMKTLEKFNEKKKIRDERKKKLLHEVLSNMRFQDNSNINNSNNSITDSDSLTDKEFQEAMEIFGLEEYSNRVNDYCDNFLKTIKIDLIKDAN